MKVVTELTTCDGCGKDLSYGHPSSPGRYRLVLQNDNIPARGQSNVMWDVAIKPPLDRPHHFCGVRCIDKWRNPTDTGVSGESE